MVNNLIAISLLQFATGILACLVIVQVTVHLCIAIQKMMHLLHISHRVEDNMILTTTNTENYGREEIHKTLVQMQTLLFLPMRVMSFGDTQPLKKRLRIS